MWTVKFWATYLLVLMIFIGGVFSAWPRISHAESGGLDHWKRASYQAGFDFGAEDALGAVTLRSRGWEPLSGTSAGCQARGMHAISFDGVYHVTSWIDGCVAGEKYY